MEKVGEEEENTIEEAIHSCEDTRSDKEDERIMCTITKRFDPVDYTEEGSTDPSNSQTVTFFDDHDHVSEYEMEDEKVLELFRHINSPHPNKPDGMVLEFQGNIPAETEQTNRVNLDSAEVLEGIKSSSSSASAEDIEDSSSNSDLDFSLSRYYFDGSLPVSAHVGESETHQDESHVPKDENQMPLLCLKQPVPQPTSWRNCCGLLELLQAAVP